MTSGRQRGEATRPEGMGRRDFLRGGAAALGLGLLPAAGRAAPGIEGRAVLGRTGLRIPDIGFGGSRLHGDTELVRYAYDRGVRYFDTAQGYTDGESEETLGAALQGLRDRVVIASKVEAKAGARRSELMTALEGSLRRLRTDHIDVYFNHAVNDVARMRNPEWPEFTARAREMGKIRFAGMSGHGGRLVECLDYALDHDLVDVVLVAFNFGQDERFYEKFTRGMDYVARQPELPRVLAKAREKQVGVVAMKTLMGGRLNDLRAFETEGSTYAQAALRWVVSHPLADALIVTMKSRAAVDEYLVASGWSRPRRSDLPLLAAYLECNGRSQCRYGCGACAAACPHGVPISDVLRSRMYAEDYGDAELGRAEYAALGRGAEACLSCAERSCGGACPYGLDIHGLGSRAHRLLSPGSPGLGS